MRQEERFVLWECDGCHKVYLESGSMNKTKPNLPEFTVQSWWCKFFLLYGLNPRRRVSETELDRALVAMGPLSGGLDMVNNVENIQIFHSRQCMLETMAMEEMKK